MRNILTLVALAATTIPGASAAPRGIPRADKGKVYDMPVDRYNNGFNTEVITIGTPPQKTLAFVDWTWIGAYVVSTMCNHTQDLFGCAHPDQPYFNQSESTTFVNQTDLYPSRNWNPNHFFFDKDLRVNFASDVYRVDDEEQRITIQPSHLNWKMPTAYEFNTIFGMSPVFKGDNASIQAPFYQMMQKRSYRSGITSFVYCYENKIGDRQPPREICNGHDGMQTLGGYHREHITWRGIEWYDNTVFPIINEIDFIYDPAIYNYWTIPVTKHLIGDEEQALNQSTGAVVAFDHASYGRGAAMSKGSYRRLIEMTEAKPIELDQKSAPNNGKQDWFSVDCSKVASFPPVKYQFGKRRRTWKIPAEHYVEKIQTEGQEDVCVLDVRVVGEGEDFIIGNLGDNFAKDKVILFDFLRLRVGVADLKY